MKQPDATTDLEIADMVRCRKRSLEYNQYPILVFSPLDAIQEIHDGVLGDICFAAKPQRKVSASLQLTLLHVWLEPQMYGCVPFAPWRRVLSRRYPQDKSNFALPCGCLSQTSANRGGSVESCGSRRLGQEKRQ